MQAASQHTSLTMEQKQKLYTVFSLGLVQYLYEKGFKFVGTAQNIQFPDKNVFYYEDTPELQEHIHDYIEYKHNINK